MSDKPEVDVVNADGASEAVAPVAKKVRAKVYSKEDLVAAFHPALEAIVGARLSKQKAWDAYKAAMGATFQLCSRQSLSLSGVGKFYTFESKRSIAKDKPAKRLRFRPSSRVIETLNTTGDFMAAAAAPEAPESAPITEAPATPTAPSTPTAPADAPVEL